MREDDKRKKRFTNRAFQVWFSGFYALACILAMFISAALFQFFALNRIEQLRWRMMVHENTVADIILPYMIYSGIFATLFTILALFFFSKILRWKIIRPLHRLQRDLALVREGNLTVKICFRKASPFQETGLPGKTIPLYGTAEALDKTVISLREKYARLNKEFRGAKKIIHSLPATKNDLLPAKCYKLRTIVGDFKKELRPS
jgi:hypothetical protein